MAGKDQNYVKNILNNNLRSEGREMIDWSFYDSVLTTANVAQTATLFQNTVGSVGISRTNMKSAGQLPSPQSFALIGISIMLINLDGAPLFMAGGAAPSNHPASAIFGQMTWKFKLEPSTDYEGHGEQFFNFPHYLNDSGALLAVSPVSTSPLWKTLKFKAPILIPSTRAFSVETTFTTPAESGGYTAANTALYCFIHGLLRRNS